MAAQSLSDVGMGGLVFMLVLGLLLALWPLVVITNFRGYRDSHASRSMGAAGRLKHQFGSEADRRFTNVVQFIVAGVFLVAACALIVVATVQIAGRVT